MPRTLLLVPHLLCSALLVLCNSAAALEAAAAQTSTSHAAGLLAKQAEFQTQLQGKAFGEPLHLVWQDSGNRLHADVYAELSAPFAAVTSLLSGPKTL